MAINGHFGHIWPFMAIWPSSHVRPIGPKGVCRYSHLDEMQKKLSRNPGFGDLRSPCLKSRAQTIYAAFFFNRCSSEYISCRNPDHFRQLSICEVQNFLILIFECSSNHRARKKSLTVSCCYQWRWQGLLRVVTTTTIKSKLT